MANRDEEGTPTFDKLVEEIQRLKDGVEILKRVWIEKGPYGMPFSEQLQTDMQRYFNFDDSE